MACWCRDHGISIEQAYVTIIDAGKICKPTPVNSKVCMAKVDSAYSRSSTSEQYWKLILEGKGNSRMIKRRELKDLSAIQSETSLTNNINVWLAEGKIVKLNGHGDYVIRENSSSPLERLYGETPRIKIVWPFHLEHLIPSITIGDSSLWSAVTNSGKTIASLWWLLANKDFKGKLIYFQHHEASSAKFNEQLKMVCDSLNISVDYAWNRVDFLQAPADGVYIGMFPSDEALISVDHVINNVNSYMIGEITNGINVESKKVKGHVMIFTQAHAANPKEKGAVARTFGGESGTFSVQHSFVFDKYKVRILKSKDDLIGLDGHYSLDDSIITYDRSLTGIGWNINTLDIPRVPAALQSNLLRLMRKGTAKIADSKGPVRLSRVEIDDEFVEE
jgi:hypothetical protein